MERLEQVAVNTGLKIVGSIAPMAGLDYQHTRFFWNFPQLAGESKRRVCGPDETLAIINTGMSFAGPQRNDASRRMWGDWLFMVDADMMFPMNTLEVLLRTQREIAQEHGDCGVLVGVYPKRELPPSDVLLYTVNPETGLWRAMEPQEIDWQKPGRCDAAGAGCMLVMREVVERIVMELNVPPFLWWGPLSRDALSEPLGAETEDLAFCRRLTLLDPPVQMWYTVAVMPTHLATVQVSTQDWLTGKREQRQLRVQAVGSASAVA